MNIKTSFNKIENVLRQILDKWIGKEQQLGDIYAIAKDGSHDEELIEKSCTIHLQLVTATHKQSTIALIDSGEDCNVMSYKM